MGDVSEKITSSKFPKYANENRKRVEIKQMKCNHCGSKNTICIYSDTAASNIGVYIYEEYFCTDCQFFTTFEYEYDS